jgi:peptide chain release factor 1
MATTWPFCHPCQADSGSRIPATEENETMFDKLSAVEAQYERLMIEMADPSLHGDTAKFRANSKAVAELQPLVDSFREYKTVIGDLTATEALLKDADMRELAPAELLTLEGRRDQLLADLKLLLVPKDPNDLKNVVLEIRAGAGGDEAALFASDLFRMYSRYAERQGWRVEVLNLSESGAGGTKEVTATIEGRGVYSRLKYESGVHRVQRVPTTEASGRIHTSTATVAVLPEAAEVDIHIDPKDLRIDTFCSSGPGGQSVNTTYSAVRITHLPTNTVVSQQDEKSQVKNRAKAMKVLRSRLYEMEMRKQQEAIAKDRRTQVGTGDRSEKIRTYNFRENRITDHRIGFTMHQLTDALDGSLDDLIDAAVTHFTSEKLKEATESDSNGNGSSGPTVS